MTNYYNSHPIAGLHHSKIGFFKTKAL